MITTIYFVHKKELRELLKTHKKTSVNMRGVHCNAISFQPLVVTSINLQLSQLQMVHIQAPNGVQFFFFSIEGLNKTS